MRFDLTRKTDLALRSLRALHGRTERTPGSRLAAEIGTTQAFVGQVVSPLVQAGWVRSRPGRAGGYSLTDQAAGVSLLEVMEAVEGPIDDGKCVLIGGPCGTDKCLLHEAWSAARLALRESFDSVPVCDE